VRRDYDAKKFSGATKRCESAEQTATDAQREIEQLRAALDKEQRARELAERDAAAVNEQLREQRVELARVREELQTVRSEGEAAKVGLARLEGKSVLNKRGLMLNDASRIEKLPKPR